MKVEVTPRTASAAPGNPVVFTIQVFNTEPLISGHKLRVLGADSEWAGIDQPELSLFPGTTGVSVLSVNFPKGSPAGARRLSVEVRELTEPYDVAVVDLTIEVPAQPSVSLKLDPVSVNAGRKASIAAVVANTGNVTQEVALQGVDDEGHVEFVFAPGKFQLVPAESRAVVVSVRARRPLAGSPKVRPFTIESNGTAQMEVPVQAKAFGSFVQRPWLSRGQLALVGLLLAATAFTAVIVATMAQINNQQQDSSSIVLQALQASLDSQAGANGGTGGAELSGKVTPLAGGGQGLGGVTAYIYSAADTTNALASTATQSNGTYAFTGLAPGAYKLQFTGAGFADQWYPDATGPDSATPVNLVSAQDLSGVNVQLGGLPATISGTVTGPSPGGALVTLEANSANPALQSAVVTSTSADATGNFSLVSVPSPATYQLLVSKPGYATATQVVTVSSGETDQGVTVLLQLGDGTISGTISAPTGPLGGATVSATGGSSGTPVTSSTVSLTTGHPGAFILHNLPTPGNFTVVVSKPGFASQTLELQLSAGQQLKGVSATLTAGTGDIAGRVTLADGSPAGGVSVTVSDGALSVTTATLSEASDNHPAGSFQLGGLPAPGTYEMTFSRSDLLTETREVQLAAPGAPVQTGTFSGALPGDVTVVMQPALGALYGSVHDSRGRPLGGVSVSVTSGTTSYAVTTADVPVAGSYEVDNLSPGTYTVSFTDAGSQPSSSVVTVTAGTRVRDDAVLAAAASVDGYVDQLAGSSDVPLPGATVSLFDANQYPGTAVATTTTDANGYFKFSPVDAPQEYIVQYAYPAGTPGQKTADFVLSASQAEHLPMVVLATGTGTGAGQGAAATTTSSPAASASTTSTSASTTTTAPTSTTAPVTGGTTTTVPGTTTSGVNTGSSSTTTSTTTSTITSTSTSTTPTSTSSLATGSSSSTTTTLGP
ncbi:MAG TPA: carboxypeptidase-like regulatory domain-containing protein [Acidimicrobiales bacterium]|nr:carboxypeptidase-like regulatory domain-containing protein [Acidimicrobiales bacterium]